MIAGLVGTFLLRLLLIALRLDAWIRPRAFAYPAIGIFLTLLSYLLFFAE